MAQPEGAEGRTRAARFAKVLAAALLATNACATERDPAAAARALTARFAAQAEQVLAGRRSSTLVAVPGHGFAPAPPADTDPVSAAGAALAARRGLRAAFPERGEDPVRLTLADDFAVDVRELGLAGRGRIEGRALVYPRGAGQSSFWTATESGYEEWLLLATPHAGPLAQWEVRGATLRGGGAAVEVLDAAGQPRLRITAPAAYAVGGRPVAVELAVDGSRLALGLGASGPAPGPGDLLLVDPLWEVTGSLATSRAAHTATLLPTGKVLVAGGWGAGGPDVYVASAELYDPATGTFVPTDGPLKTARHSHAATLLPSGQVLLTGGKTAPGALQYLTTAELYDPASRTFTATAGPLTTGRTGHTATLLPTGEVLLAGGCSSSACSPPLAAADLFQPATRTFVATTGPLATGRDSHTATLLPSGHVLVAGGSSGPLAELAAAELYDPGARTFAKLTATLATARRSHSATLLPSGDVLLAGGYNSTGLGRLASAELFDGAGFTALAAPLVTRRSGHSASLLPSGAVLLAGGDDGSVADAAASTELYAPGPRTFTAGPLLATARTYHTATLLPSGQLLAVGGCNFGCAAPFRSVELLDPGDGGFTTPAGVLATGRHYHTATLLATGDVLIAGGSEGSGYYPTLGTAELYHPATGGVAAPNGPMTTIRTFHSATLLPSGKVLLAGGCAGPGCGSAVYDSAELYDPGAGTFTATAGKLATPRFYHAATLLPSGTVLLAGGYNFTDGALVTAEVFDPATGTFTPTGALANGRAASRANLLADGRVLLTGGLVAGGGAVSTAELYDPAAGTFAPAAGALLTARYDHTATLLASSQVLLAGGYNNVLGKLASTELFDPVTGLFAPPPAGPLTTPRRYHTATLLSSGRVLLAGGDSDTAGTAELYHPAAGAFTLASAPMATARHDHTATLLPSGRVLIAGGQQFVGMSVLELVSLELFTDVVVGDAAWAPTLDGPLPAVTPGGALPLTGAGFTGISEASGGDRAASSTNFPLLRLRRLDSEELTYAPTSGWGAPPTSTSATAAIPATITPGRHLAWVVVNGIPSNGQLLRVDGLASGAPCQASLSCVSGRCADHRCCDTTCTGPCRACDLAGHAGVCTLVPLGDQDVDTCAGGSYCDGAGVCNGKRGAAESCTVDGECTSGFCVDGRCCNRRCAEVCQACDVSGYLGTCSPVPLGQQDPVTCTGSSYCDASSACVARQAPGASCTVGGECASGLCVDGRCCNDACADTCRACNVAGSLGSCAAVPLGAQDPGTCTGSGYCTGAGVCATKQSQGAPCAVDGECASSHCTDGYCCDSPCASTCRACDVPGSLGTCTLVPLGQHDPLLCTGGNFCDGAGVCSSQLGNGASCTVSGQCLSGYCAQGRCCDSGCSSACQACDLAGSPGTCTSLLLGETVPGRCEGTSRCNGAGACKLADGQPCANDSACASDHCVDGVCCDGPCDGNCSYCKQAGSEGTCLPVADGQDPRRACQAAVGGHASCDGSCQSGQCAFPDTGTSCGACAACDGTGRCTVAPADDAACGVIACGGLSTACRAYGDLTANRCAAVGVCKTANDPASCTQYTEISCADGGPAQSDAGAPPRQDASSGGSTSSGCSAAPGAASPWVLLGAALGLAAAPRRRRRR